jgi:5,10-methylene-tetrahydrofolate dehydrogenase/methenyl tetrahydrofolate cyclohydrolase
MRLILKKPSGVHGTKVCSSIYNLPIFEGWKPSTSFSGLIASKIDEQTFVPCTPLGIMEILKHADIDLEGKNAVVIGRSHIVGQPLLHHL